MDYSGEVGWGRGRVPGRRGEVRQERAGIIMVREMMGVRRVGAAASASVMRAVGGEAGQSAASSLEFA
ncbi:hypothetical protein BH20ACI3_BH20ACI3_39870 [soil metagenome]